MGAQEPVEVGEGLFDDGHRLEQAGRCDAVLEVEALRDRDGAERQAREVHGLAVLHEDELGARAAGIHEEAVVQRQGVGGAKVVEVGLPLAGDDL